MMKRKKVQNRLNSKAGIVHKKRQWWKRISLGILIVLTCWLVINTVTLVMASSKPVDAFLVLGGSIRREIYVADLAKKYPQTPVLISQGSKDACVRLIFEKQLAQMQNVWLEKCARSTFGNFYYSLPILKSWKVHKIKLITSPTHLPRAKWMAQIIFGSHGIWVEPDIVKETGRPGNKEMWYKTAADLTRSLVWVPLSQVIQPKCKSLVKLVDVDMNDLSNRRPKCERQGNVGN